MSAEKKKEVVTNLAAVRALLKDARPVPIVSRKASPEPSLPRDGIEAGKWLGDALGLPPGCPVKPLGITGNAGYFLDPIGQLQKLEPPYGKGHLLGLFAGDENYLCWAWPRWGKKGIDGYAAEKAAACLIQACAARGPYDSVERERGRGAWLSRSGDILLHTGTAVWVKGRREPPGEIDGHVYQTRPQLPLPWPQEVPADANPVRMVLPMLASWHWGRPDVDPRLLLGWLGASFVGGALGWRPAVYITGDAATGKSTLQSLTKMLLGEYAIQAVDTSGAGIYQHIGKDALAVAVDELEGETDTRKAKNVLKLARIAASGGLMLRGGDRHNPVEFRARSCFLFSSINTPPLDPQDLSRMAILRLKRLPPEQERPDLDPLVMTDVGRCMLRRMIDQWDRMPQTLAAFRAELGRAGWDGRGQDTFGALLACADMLEYDGWSDERLKVPSAEGDLKPISELMAARHMIEFEDRTENWRLCLSHLLNVRVDAWRSGNRFAVGKLLEDLFKGHDDINEHSARAMLGQAGLGLVRRKGSIRDFWLAVPNQNPLTRQLFDGSKWGGDMGAGVWAGALRQSPEGRIHRVGSARVNGDVQPATQISLEGLYGDCGIMRESEGEE